MGTSYTDFLNSINEIKNKYQEKLSVKDKVPELTQADYQKIEYSGKTDDEIAGLAAANLNDYKINTVNNINSESENATKDYLALKENVDKSKQAQDTAIESNFSAAQKNTSDNALKRGLARSSIVLEQLSELENSKAAKLSDNSKAAADEIVRIDNEINGLESKRQKALNDFDIIYASKLTVEIENLKQERENKTTEALKYNNSIEEKKAADEKDNLKFKQDYLQNVYDLINSEADLTAAEKKLSAKQQAEIDESFNAFLNGLTPREALNYLYYDSAFKDNMSIDAYNTIVNEMEKKYQKKT